ncbi:LysR family transcriptional regulator [uncultured Tateyamaria sp.]|uniref:LysR family transcriptional regulator n=1 Tax=uncultured Tateyamaria sp. TaxID=455651 RepID=UPI0026300E82|nr:LysR family transcriptional regulator [uncultured Tateyamaria sp.]
MQKIERAFTDGNLLKTFIEIADCRNLTLAASRLNRSQSAISVQIRRLETELDTTLFIREGKGMSLSSSGEKLLPVARRSLFELSKVQSLFATPLNGRIRVGIPDDFDEGVLEKALTEFSLSNPGVDVVATSGCTARFPEAIQKGELDIAVCSAASAVPGEVFREQQSVWVASKTMQLGAHDPVPLAIINHGCWMGELPKVKLDEQGRDYGVAFECSGIMSQKAAIRAGFAVGILYESNVEPGMRILTKKDNFPSLPKFKRAIVIATNAPQDLARAMSRAIRQAV